MTGSKGSDFGFIPLDLGGSTKRSAVPELSGDSFRSGLLSGVAAGWRISAFFALPSPEGRPTELWAILSDDGSSRVLAARSLVKGSSFPSIASACPQAQLFEREIAEQAGLLPEGHPWLKPVRGVPPMNGRPPVWESLSVSQGDAPAMGDFYRVEGEEVHEVAVGPVHAGIIEPGHFRFQCQGEIVHHLEIALGYQHRGAEEALASAPEGRARRIAETLAGDSSVAHSTCRAQALEALSGVQPSARALALRGIALELERIANHVGDLGALSGDAGFLPTASFCGRIRGEFLNMTALLCGNRFGRGLVLPGGAAWDLDADRSKELLRRLDLNEADALAATDLLWATQSVMARLEDTGRLTRQEAVELGLVGPAARACGLARDLRFNQPAGIYRFAQIPVATVDSGDVYARSFVRALEIRRSAAFIREQLSALPGGEPAAAMRRLSPSSVAVSLVEAWRGEACHVLLTDARGNIARYKAVDPSFHNWAGLARALRGQEISDFPLCNKSFNLSYCGHDL